MNSNTGEIREEKDLTLKEVQSGKWFGLSPEDLKEVSGMNRSHRRAWLKKNKYRLQKTKVEVK